MKTERRAILLAAAVLVLLSLLVSRAHHAARNRPAPPDFTLTEAAGGRSVSLDGFRGRWVLVYFGYTHCRGNCTGPLAGMQKAAAARHDVSALFVTLDPERDDAERLAAFAGPFAPAVTALTGSADAIAAAERAFGVYAVPHDTPRGVRFDRSNLIYVVDPRGRLAGHVDGDAPPGIISSSIGKPVP